MPPDERDTDSAVQWLRLAESDLAEAVEPHSKKVLSGAVCFHSQQCAEKSIKAVLVRKKVSFPFTHNISQLIDIVRDSGIQWPADLDEAADLSVYAVHSRYPSILTEVSDEDCRKAIEIAEKVIAWAEKEVQS